MEGGPRKIEFSGGGERLLKPNSHDTTSASDTGPPRSGGRSSVEPVKVRDAGGGGRGAPDNRIFRGEGLLQTLQPAHGANFGVHQRPASHQSDFAEPQLAELPASM